MSKKRKHPNQKRGGRYTPPGGGLTARGVEGSWDGPDGTSVHRDGFSISGTFGLHDEDLEDDDRYPVTIDLPSYGPWTVPQAFAFWLHGDDRYEEFDEFICERRDRQIHGDVFAAFVEGREDVTADVRQAIAGYGDFMDEYFGPPA